jgi:hypothetical protein
LSDSVIDGRDELTCEGSAMRGEPRLIWRRAMELPRAEALAKAAQPEHAIFGPDLAALIRRII